MKNFLAFYGDCQYPQGGMDDFIGDFDTEKEAIDAIKAKQVEDYRTDWNYTWAHVWSVEDQDKVFEK
jgi:hypothetical protein